MGGARDGKVHQRSDPDGALDPDAAAHQFDQALADGEAEARATGLVRSMTDAILLSDFVTLVRDRVRALERRQ